MYCLKSQPSAFFIQMSLDGMYKSSWKNMSISELHKERQKLWNMTAWVLIPQILTADWILHQRPRCWTSTAAILSSFIFCLTLDLLFRKSLTKKIIQDIWELLFFWFFFMLLSLSKEILMCITGSGMWIISKNGTWSLIGCLIYANF
jgi:hypothetical protein